MAAYSRRRTFGFGTLAAAILLGWLALLTTVAPAAAARWTSLTATVFHNYGRDEGLPHPVPTALAQDRDGFLWIGTQGGLARWDGYRFRTYHANPTVAGSLPDDWIQTLHIDRTGRLWIGGGAGGLGLYDAEHDRFIRMKLGRVSDRTHIGAIADAAGGGLWIGTDDGLYRLRSANSRFVRVQGAFPAAPVRALLQDRTGGLWVGTTRGLARRTSDAATFEPVPLAGGLQGITALLEDGDGRIWVGTARHGVFRLDSAGGVPRHLGPDSMLGISSVSSFSVAGPHEIWIGLRGSGVVSVDTRTGTILPIRHDRTVSTSLAHNDVWALLRDSAGSLWVASTGGLSYRSISSGLISTIIGSQQQPRGLSSSDPLSVLSTRDGRIWLGYLDGGVDVIDPETGRVAALRPGTTGDDNSLPPDIVLAMAEDDDGNVYIGTGRGLYRTDRSARSVRLIPIPGCDPHASIISLTFDAGVLWIGGEEDGLTGMVPGRRGVPDKVIFGAHEKAKLADGGVNTILRGRGEDLWVGARNGLYRIDLSTHAVEHIVANPAEPTALPARFVVASLIDRKGRLWVGTFGGGLAMMTGRGTDGRPHFRRFGLAEGLPHLNVDSLEMDGSGTIWAGTDEGLARIDPKTLALRAVRQADGSPLVDYFAGAGTSTPQGEALFGAKGGVTIVRPGKLPRWTLQPPLVVTDLRIAGVSQPVAPLNSRKNPTPIVLTPDTNSIAVEFAALDYTAPGRNRYAYRLDGFDRDWTQTDASRRLAIYTNLPPGNYTLRLRGSNRAGIWTERELSLPIQVLPAWYQHMWFRLAAIAIIALAMFAIVRWRTRYLRRRQTDLERQIADRTADLRAANERLGTLAMTDPLTGCANRRHFMALAKELTLAAESEGPLSLAILDLDEFKRINDRHGHPGGDAALAMTGDVIRRNVRPGDVAGRMGGEEFALLMPGTTLTEAQKLTERLREAIARETIDTGTETIGITASFGVAELQSEEDFSRFYARTDAALYAAKGSGRNRVESAA